MATGPRHSIGVTAEGRAYSWGKSNAVGQLGRDDAMTKPKIPGLVPIPVKVARAFVSQGCATGSGHSAVLDVDGNLWMAGCDRWQQLGLGSSKGGSSGYTWIDGKLWQDRFRPSKHILELMTERDTSTSIRDVALGGDHTVVLSSNGLDVFVYGKGGDGQLGMVGKPFVSAPARSKVLSGERTAAVCAVEKCSLTLDEEGSVMRKVGKCRTKVVEEGIKACILSARHDGLIN